MSGPRSTSNTVTRWLVILFAAGLAPVAVADDYRASVNYTLHCQGCHLANASGFENEVPRMKDFVGYFLHSSAGRAFLIQVPGVATASLQDEQLTELMNWLLLTYSKAQLPESFDPYSVSEVGALRARIEPEPQATRIRILDDIARALPALAEELQKQHSR